MHEDAGIAEHVGVLAVVPVHVREDDEVDFLRGESPRESRALQRRPLRDAGPVSTTMFWPPTSNSEMDDHPNPPSGEMNEKP